MSFTPLNVKIDATVVVTQANPLNPAVSKPVYQGVDFSGFADAQASNADNQGNLNIPANTSANVPLPAGTTNSKFLFYRFNNPVNLSGLVSAQNTRYGILEITSAVALTVAAGINDTQGFVMILGA